MKSLIAMAAQTALAASAALALCALPAEAQTGKGGKAPIDITADQAEFHNNDCRYVYTGSVEALQDTARLRSDVMIAHMEVTKGKGGTASASQVNGCGATTSVEAKGHVYYAAADGRRLHGDNGFYDLGASTITFTGDVTAVDASNNVMRGSKMVYNTQTGEGHVEGQAKGANAKNRPRGVFYPKDSEAQPASPDQPAGDKKKKAAK